MEVPSGFTSYVLAVENDRIGFYRKDGGFKVYNNKAYLCVPANVGNASTLYLNFDDDATGIVETENENEGQRPEGMKSKRGTEIYDLSGRRVEKVQKGVYIVNGKKVLK